MNYVKLARAGCISCHCRALLRKAVTLEKIGGIRPESQDLQNSAEDRGVGTWVLQRTGLMPGRGALGRRGSSWS